MKTCNIKGNVSAYTDLTDFLKFVKQLIVGSKITPSEGVLAVSHFNSGHRMVSVDGSPLLELAEVQDEG